MMFKNQKTKNLLGLVAAGATLASSVFVFAVEPAQAALNNWSFSGLANTSGAFVAADDATSRLSIIAQTEGTEGEGDEGEEPIPTPQVPPTGNGGEKE